MVHLSSKENRWDGLAEVFQSLASLSVMRLARFDGLRFGLEFANFDQGEIVPLV